MPTLDETITAGQLGHIPDTQHLHKFYNEHHSDTPIPGQVRVWSGTHWLAKMPKHLDPTAIGAVAENPLDLANTTTTVAAANQAAIQACIDVAGFLGGGTVWLDGKFWHNDEFDMVNDGVVLESISQFTGGLHDSRTSGSKAWTVNTVNGSAVVTVTAGTIGTTLDEQGRWVTGAGIREATDIVSVSGSTVTLSQPATATATGVTLTVKTLRQIKVHGTSPAARVTGTGVKNMALTSAGGRNDRTGIDFMYVSFAVLDGTTVWSSAVAYKGHDLWDSDFHNTRDDQCGSTNGDNLYPIELWSSSVDGTDCNSVWFWNHTSETSARIARFDGYNRRTNKCRIYGKLETNQARGPVLFRMGLTSHCVLGDGLDISIGGFASGVTTPVDLVEVENALGGTVGRIMLEQNVGAGGTNTVDDMIHLKGGNKDIEIRGIIPQNAASAAIAGHVLRYTGTNEEIDDELVPEKWTYEANSVVYCSFSGTPTSRKNAGVRTIAAAAHTVAYKDRVLFVDPTAASQTITLPTPEAGRTLVIVRKTAGANTTTVQRAGAALIDGALTSVVLRTRGEHLRLVGDGTGWWTNRDDIDFTPTFAGGAVPNVGTTGLRLGSFTIDDKGWCDGTAFIKWSGTGKTAGTGLYLIDTPVPADLSQIAAGASSILCGGATLVDASIGGGLTAGSHIIAALHITSASKFLLVISAADAAIDNAYGTEANPIAWAATDGNAIMLRFRFKVA